jgi:carboxymethylenebutenolidase
MCELEGCSDRVAVPVQIHHGTADTSVKDQESEKLYAMLKAKGVRSELWLYEGAEHGFLAYTRPFYRADQAKQAWQRSVAFLTRYLHA